MIEQSQAGAERQADRSQGDVFRAELLKQIALLDEQAAACKAALASYVKQGSRNQAQRLQHELRLCAVERRKLTNMLDALTRRFPLRQTQPIE